ncbi:ABC transporter permease [Cellulomonas septica]|uniref:Polyketide antibiotic transporter n=1 Tax=Cellulomonas septica TaxID=285080 RepID=A0ABX1JXM6_9CELL|nr:polyketide antibiotic transporter [Cellulomonas septica]NKY38060.1 polyketide antibiotic transporter [Cellulomonas septica]
MSTPTVAITRRAALGAEPRPWGVLTRHAAHQVYRGGLVVSGICAGMSAVVVGTYTSQGLDLAALEALASNPAIRTLFGEPVALDEAGGFTVWRTGTALAVLLGLWSLLAATRTTRGEEDAGRWNLLLAGRATLREAVLSHLAVLSVVPLVAGTATALAMVAAGADVTGSLLHGGGLTAVGVFFVALGGLTAQVYPSRSAAAGAATAVLLVTFGARMVGDGVDVLAGLRWFSPFGLMGLSRPFDADRAAPLAVLIVTAAVLLAAAARASGRRDVQGALLRSATVRTPRTALLGSVTTFAVRRALRALVGWSLGVGAYFLLVGLIARSMTDFLAENPQFAQMAAQAGFTLGTVEGYAATLFALLAVPAGAFAAIRLATLAADEEARRLTPLLAAPVTRTHLLAAETAVAAGGALVLTLVAGLSTWWGCAAVGADLSLSDSVGGALNVLPIVLLSAGFAVLALGWLPRAVALIGALPAAGGFLWLVLADSVGAPAWVGNLSPFAHLAPVPVTEPGWLASTVMVAVAATASMVGVAGYRRRDIRA